MFPKITEGHLDGSYQSLQTLQLHIYKQSPHLVSIVGRPTKYMTNFSSELSEGNPVLGRGGFSVSSSFNLEFDGWMIYSIVVVC